MPTVLLPDRAVIVVAGPEAEHFLQNIVTTDLSALGADEAKPGALLTPQGKILFDFLISRSGEDAFRLDCRAEAADDFVRRLTLYKLRAKAQIGKQDESLVAARWQDDSSSSETDSSLTALADRRFPADAGVERLYGPSIDGDADERAWQELRIRHGVAEGGADFALGEAFPHDVLLDQMQGVGFTKGCYVGQEVVSRMHHRGTARRRVLIAQGAQPLPPPGTDLVVEGKPVGTLAGVADHSGLALARIDRVKEAMDARKPIMAGNVEVSLSIPEWARFTFPEASESGE